MSRSYQPGKCNIGATEAGYRKRVVGYGSAFIALSMYIMLVYFDFPLILYGFLFIPVFVSIHGLRESKYRFCTSYARMGKYNMSDELGLTQPVSRGADRKKDQKHAGNLINGSLKLSSVMTILLITASRLVN